jgi:septation ring formation regulator EzrA
LASSEEAEVHDALKEIGDGISKAGSLIGDYDEELPPYDKFEKDFAAQDDERLKAIDACNKALEEIQDSLSITDDLLESGPPEEPAKVLREVKNGIEEVRDGLKDAVGDMGGKAE